MARRAAERDDGNLWTKEIHYPHEDLFIPADFLSSNHRFTVWSIKSGTHLMAAEWGKGYQHWYKVVLLEHGVPVENTMLYDSEGEDTCPTVNTYLALPGLIQDPPASWTDEANLCSSYKPYSWEEFEASKDVFASCSTQVWQYLLDSAGGGILLSPIALRTLTHRIPSSKLGLVGSSASPWSWHSYSGSMLLGGRSGFG